MDRADVVARYDEELNTEEYADVDASANGLQVGSEGGEVEHVAFAVDAAEATIEAAADAGADLLVVHHGLVWGGLDRVTGRTYDRIAPLVENDIGLYVSHLPLDGHQSRGNAAGVADRLELESREPFGELGPVHIGQRGRASRTYTVEGLREALDELDNGGESTQVLAFGPDEISEIAVVTGSGADWVSEAEAVGADALVTGEGKQQAYHEAREAGLNVFLAGHYATETFGVRNLAALAQEWGLEATYLDFPTGL
ncbi:Nif3-like dinuclear metal center hexameric protein [Halogeometricum luteum]|uniref:Nif3-like dinuclear metal center hexameric protein n=1 Tax=Halogeometricum luteum TaxID=2950537 RepID=A0ABU2G1L9_9EURY|nr:Nif3-like dinuclear metal center hexameric protein [Halogeometricum sp. S3BR5-2]MDS0294199.1 Nif3-like dinuclear metal center hexameric protein [Halogeometricum sp. S3BR5-2]